MLKKSLRIILVVALIVCGVVVFSLWRTNSLRNTDLSLLLVRVEANDRARSAGDERLAFVTLHGTTYRCEYHVSEILLVGEKDTKKVNYDYLSRSSSFKKIVDKVAVYCGMDGITESDGKLFIVCVFYGKDKNYKRYNVFMEWNAETEEVRYAGYAEV